MIFRPLTQTDAPRMLEWMHNDSVVHYMATDFSKKTINDCRNFISYCESSIDDKHFAIADDNNQYMGTVSLKHIQNGHAEFAITMHQDAIGHGFSSFAMDEIIKYGFEQLNLKTIYWYVSSENVRAVRFYDKHHFNRIDGIPAYVPSNSFVPNNNYIWYEVK